MYLVVFGFDGKTEGFLSFRSRVGGRTDGRMNDLIGSELYSVGNYV